MRTRVRNGVVERFRDDAYMEPPKVQVIKDNLVENFGYGKIEARRIAYEIVDNLRKYDILEQLREDSIKQRQALSDNQTRMPVRKKSILELRMEAKRGNL